MSPTIGRGGCHPKPGGSSSRRLVPAQAGIWEVDPLSCPQCGHEIKIISLIHELDVIERILRHLGLWKQHQDPQEGKNKAPADGPAVLDHFNDGWPGYEEPVIIYHQTPPLDGSPAGHHRSSLLSNPRDTASFSPSTIKTTRKMTNLQLAARYYDHHGVTPWWFLSP
jgi:hypothetical protein